MNSMESLKSIQEWFIQNQVGDKEIYVISILIFLGLLMVLLSKKIKVPIVVGYVFLGIILSPDIIKLLPFLSHTQKEWYEFTLDNFSYVTNIALSFIAFSIGSELSLRLFKKMGKSIFLIVTFEALGAFFLVTLAAYAAGQPLYLSLLLGGIATATAPAATVMVLKEYRAQGPLTSMILAIVAIDDTIALIIFSLIEPISLMRFSGEVTFSLVSMLGHPLLEIFGSIALGLILGYISQYLAVKFEDHTKKILTLVVTIVGALAIATATNLSPLITNMTVGFAYINFTRKNPGIAGYMEVMTVPLYALFFILAGTEIRFEHIASYSFIVIAVVYLLARIVGKISGSTLAAYITGAPDVIKKYVGLGLFPQSGVAIALAYTIQKDFVAAPRVGLLIFNILLFTAALTEIFGPLATRYAIFKAGEAQTGEKEQINLPSNTL